MLTSCRLTVVSFSRCWSVLSLSENMVPPSLRDESEAQPVELLEDPDQSDEVRLGVGVELQCQLVDVVQDLGLHPVGETPSTPLGPFHVHLQVVDNVIQVIVLMDQLGQGLQLRPPLAETRLEVLDAPPSRRRGMNRVIVRVDLTAFNATSLDLS